MKLVLPMVFFISTEMSGLGPQFPICCKSHFRWIDIWGPHSPCNHKVPFVIPKVWSFKGPPPLINMSWRRATDDALRRMCCLQPSHTLVFPPYDTSHQATLFQHILWFKGTLNQQIPEGAVRKVGKINFFKLSIILRCLQKDFS